MNISPVMPTDIKNKISNHLLILAEAVCIKSASLLSGYTPEIISSIKELLRITNSYYSNRIEAQSTHPLEIEKAMREEFSEDTKSEALQRLSLSHIQVQRWIEESIKTEEVISREFIKEIHSKFYGAKGMDSFLIIKTQKEVKILAKGTFREEGVQVGKHKAPHFQEIAASFNYFESSYQRINKDNTKAMKLLSALSAHHRLVYIHPFLDGNGRVSRLFLDAMLFNIQLEGYGLWNISRGLARDVKNYQKSLAHADMKKQGTKDGNGELSLTGLEYFLEFMLKVALEQIDFMQQSLNLKELDERTSAFVKLSQAKMYRIEPLPKYSELLFSKLLLAGEVERGEVEVIISKSKKTAYSLVKKLLEMNYLESSSPRGAIRLKFNTFFASKILPDLIPE